MEKLHFLHWLTEGAQEAQARCLVIATNCKKSMGAYNYVDPNQEKNYVLILAKVKVGPYGMAHKTLECHCSNYFLDGDHG